MNGKDNMRQLSAAARSLFLQWVLIGAFRWWIG
jgi:hypothetical protein